MGPIPRTKLSPYPYLASPVGLLSYSCPSNSVVMIVTHVVTLANLGTSRASDMIGDSTTLGLVGDRPSQAWFSGDTAVWGDLGLLAPGDP